jgi:hypothetical protein
MVMDDENPDLDLDPTMWIPVPRIPEKFPEDLPDRIEAVMKRFRERKVEEAVRAVAEKKDG